MKVINYLKIVAKLLSQPTHTKYIIFTDIDDTLLRFSPNATSDQLVREDQITKDMLLLANKEGIPIIPVTGRGLNIEFGVKPLFEGRLQIEYDNFFDITVSDGCTVINHQNNPHNWQIDTEYDERLEKESGFSREKIYATLTGTDGINVQLQQEFSDTLLRFQPRDTPENIVKWNAKEDSTMAIPPQKYKISYIFESTDDIREKVHARLEQLLLLAGFDKVVVLTSRDKILSEHVCRYNIDIMPVNKAFPVNYIVPIIQNYLTESDPSTKLFTIVVGNDGNDKNMILSAGDIGMCVADSTQELTNTLIKNSLYGEGDLKIYQIQGKKRPIYISPYPGPQALYELIKNREVILRDCRNLLS